MNFVDYDYTTGVATEYVRDGICKQCGDCCKTTINMRMVDGDKYTHGGYTTDGDGRWSEVSNNGTKEYVKFYMPHEEEGNSPCPALALDGSNVCLWHDSEEGDKPWACRVWPTAPSDIESFENCTYKFVMVAQWEFETT